MSSVPALRSIITGGDTIIDAELFNLVKTESLLLELPELPELLELPELQV
jgi:hypothetical protein